MYEFLLVPPKTLALVGIPKAAEADDRSGSSNLLLDLFDIVQLSQYTYPSTRREKHVEACSEREVR